MPPSSSVASPQSLVVVLTHVVYSRHGRLASECCVRTVVVVMVQPLRERPTAFLVRPIELGIGPLGEQGLDEALGFAVGLGPVGADDLVTDLQAGDGFPEGARGDVAVRPIRHHALDPHALLGKEGGSIHQEPRSGATAAIGQHLDERQAGGVAATCGPADLPPRPGASPAATCTPWGATRPATWPPD